ncbi:MAG: PQQ-dependent sugar dehydrogenase [Deltaproteobacteria bacterium]|nr:PQQ-dependent sugar dehydrogenase [Deltaproteobacteria bacterium]
MRTRWLLVISLVSVLGGCGDRFAVNAPIMNSLFGWGGEPPSAEGARRLKVASGYEVSLYSVVPGVRMLVATPRGDLIGSIPREGRVVLLSRDKNEDGAPDSVRDLLTGLSRPHGLALSPDGWLYVGEAASVGRVRFDVATGAIDGALETVVSGLPEGGNHWSRNVGIGPDGMLYVTVGSSCNVCFEDDERRAAMLRYAPDGSGYELYARGLRNAVDFAWRPVTNELFATDNGRDLLGDDFPPCELNRVVRGGDYGWPVANGDRIADPDLGAGQEARIAASIPPAFAFNAHNAPLGITFLAHPAQPASHRGVALAALHGSWNRTRKDGYRVVALRWDAAGAVTQEDFLSGFLVDDEVFGRPVDVVEAPNSGTIYVSDDYGGAIYAIRPKGTGPAGGAAPAPQAAAAAGRDSLAALDPSERAALIAQGEAAWGANACATCHDVAVAAPGMVTKPLTALHARFDLDSLTTFFAAPTPPMPAPPLDEAGRRALAAYVLGRFGD